MHLPTAILIAIKVFCSHPENAYPFTESGTNATALMKCEYNFIRCAEEGGFTQCLKSRLKQSARKNAN